LAFSVLYDANALFGALQRSILVRVGTYQKKINLGVLLTERVLDEMVLGVDGADLSRNQLNAHGCFTNRSVAVILQQVLFCNGRTVGR